MDRVEKYLDAVSKLLAAVPREDVRKIADLVVEAYRSGKQVFVMGNGGSAATASHLVCDLQKGVSCASELKLKVMAVTDNVPLMTAWANDFDYSEIFAQQIRPWLEPGDLVIGISGSGNSPNVIKAIEMANERGAVTAGLAGFDGGKLAKVAAYSVVVPSSDMQHIEDVHVVLAHLIYRYVLEEISC